MRAYAIRVAMLQGQSGPAADWNVLEDNTHLFPHLPHALHTAEQVAAPQQLATTPNSYDCQ